LIRQTRLGAFADRTIEAGWLLVLVFAPYYFSLLSARHFEPDKATAVRSLALIMLAAWAIKTIERVTFQGERPNWSAWWRAPLALPALAYAGVFVLATLTSVSPSISFWGSYNRLQGTYTNLSYMAIFAVIIGNLRTRAQLDRLITTALLTGFSVAMYGMVQHFGQDPLPWKGDVLTRISSTMGNSIFVAAYLILIIPFALFRLATSTMAIRRAPATSSSADWIWGGVFAIMLISQQALLLGMLKFGAAVRVSDFRYWWVFPLGLAVLTATFALVSLRQTEAPSRTLTGFAGGILLLWVLLLLIVYTGSRGAQQGDPNPLVSNWGTWLALGTLGIGAVLGAMFVLPRRPEGDTRLFAIMQTVGYGVVLLVLLVAIFFSQSRGPQIGLLAGLAIFINLFLFRLERSASAAGSSRTGLLRGLMGTAFAVEIAAAIFLLAFNLSDAPFFERLREVPYVGRLGRFLETQEGTGRVRVLIWSGDDQGSGAIGLITSNPIRTIIGYGPETMFTAYNPFYPPELAMYEARGASPDRSHQALLDEMVNKGALGLLSYFFLLISAVWLAWRLLRRSTDFYYQALYVTCLAVITGHFFEGLSGIPIVSTLTMLWVSLGVLVVGGILDGQLHIAGAPAAAPVVVDTSTPAPAARPAGGGRRGGSSGGRRGATRGAAPVARPQPSQRLGSFRWTYALIAAVALFGVWAWNVQVVYADMWYNQASAFQPRSADEEVYKLSRVLSAIDHAPEEDYYHLQLGNSLIQLAYAYKARNAQSEADLAPVRDRQSYTDLFTGESAEVRASRIWQNNSVEQLLEYARLVLERAEQLNPGNKDHAANLGRLNSLWYGMNSDPERLEAALRWYERANQVAPHDVVILNEWATTLASNGPSSYPEVEAKLKEAQTLDPSYADSYVKLGNLYRIQNKNQEAVEQYAMAIERRSNALEDGRENSLDPAITALQDDPAALRGLLDAYVNAAEERPDDAGLQSAIGRIAGALKDPAIVSTAFDKAIANAPDNIKYRQQYTLALSQTEQYDAAIAQAQAGLQLAQQQQSEADIQTLSQLLQELQQQAGAGS
jgi:tetratricopeptide (TPR) repeat protein